MDFLQSILALVMILAPFAAVAAIAASAFLAKRRAAPFIAKWGAAVSCAAATVAYLRLFGRPLGGGTWLTLGTWLSAGLHDPLRIEFGLEVDAVAAGMAALMSFAALCALSANRSELVDAASERLFYIGASLLLASSIGVAMSTNLAELFMFWQLAAVGSYLMYSAHADSTRSAVAARKFILTQRVGDLFLLFGIFAIAAGFRTLDLHTLFGSPESWIRNAVPRSALVDFIGLCLLGACVARCGLFPLLGWTEDLAAGPSLVAVLVESICLMPTGVLLLLRCTPVLEIAIASAQLAMVLAALSAFAAAVCAFASESRHRTVAFACVSVLSVVVFGLFARAPAAEAWGLALLAVYIPASAAIQSVLAADSASQIVGASNWIPAPSAGLRWALSASIVVLFCGLCGQAPIVAETLQLVAPGSESSTLKLGLLFVACGQFLTGFAMGRVLVGGRGPSRSKASSPMVIETTLAGSATESHDRPLDWPANSLAAVSALIGLTAIAWSGLRWRASLHSGEFLGAHAGEFLLIIADCAIAVAGLAVGAWTFRQGRVEPASHLGGPSRRRSLFENSTLTALGRHRFYCDAVLFLFILLPIRGVAQLARFVDWFVIDGFVSGVPAGLVESAGELFSPIQRRSVAFYLLSSVVGTALLAGIIVWLRH
jgi:NADH:ubiquinone oxidoreductase subunit 5 (subunit L)/multisubunit Na+/H+ antiporter MnhA subunit